MIRDRSTAARLEAARRVLLREGIEGRVRAVGVEGEIAAVTGPSRLRARLARVAPELRAMGFRYVALDLENGRGTPKRDT